MSPVRDKKECFTEELPLPVDRVRFTAPAGTMFPDVLVNRPSKIKSPSTVETVDELDA
jgi:hypothetical protein